MKKGMPEMADLGSIWVHFVGRFFKVCFTQGIVFKMVESKKGRPKAWVRFCKIGIFERSGREV